MCYQKLGFFPWILIEVYYITVNQLKARWFYEESSKSETLGLVSTCMKVLKTQVIDDAYNISKIKEFN